MKTNREVAVSIALKCRNGHRVEIADDIEAALDDKDIRSKHQQYGSYATGPVNEPIDGTGWAEAAFEPMSNQELYRWAREEGGPVGFGPASLGGAGSGYAKGPYCEGGPIV